MKRLMVILLTIALQVNGMDAPQLASSSEIPAELQLKYSQERDRFRSYKLGDPEAKFLPLLREQLKEDNNVIRYLENLHLFANLLLAQHFLLNAAADVYYLANYFDGIKKEEAKLLAQMGAQQENEPQGYLLHIPTNAILNEIVSHNSILMKKSEPLTPEELKTVFYWSFDQNLGEFMQPLAAQRLLLNIALETKKMRNEYADRVTEQLLKITQHLQKKLNTFIDKNTSGIRALFKTYKIAKKRAAAYDQKQLEKSRNSLWDDFIKGISEQGHLYQYTHEKYEQLYKIIRAEIATTITKLLKEEPGKITNVARYVSNLFTHLIPDKVLPVQLPPLKYPIQTIVLPNLEKEKTEAKKGWDQEQIDKEIARKKQTKIKEIPNNSFILEFEDSPSSITIHNVKNNTQEIIFKHEHPYEIDKSGKKVFPINYTDWVKQWFSDPQQAIATQGYTDRTSKKFTLEQDRWKPTILHAFSPLVDDYLKEWGRVTTIKNRRNPGQEDILITIPGKIIYPAGSKPKEEAGVFAYIIDSVNGQWYHRMFTTGSLSELTKNLFDKGYFAPEMTGYYDVFFPAWPSRKK